MNIRIINSEVLSANEHTQNHSTHVEQMLLNDVW